MQRRRGRVCVDQRKTMRARGMAIPWAVSRGVMENVLVSSQWEREGGLAGVLVGAAHAMSKGSQIYLRCDSKHGTILNDQRDGPGYRIYASESESSRRIR